MRRSPAHKEAKKNLKDQDGKEMWTPDNANSSKDDRRPRRAVFRHSYARNADESLETVAEATGEAWRDWLEGAVVHALYGVSSGYRYSVRNETYVSSLKNTIKARTIAP